MHCTLISLIIYIRNPEFFSLLFTDSQAKSTLETIFLYMKKMRSVGLMFHVESNVENAFQFGKCNDKE